MNPLPSTVGNVCVLKDSFERSRVQAPGLPGVWQVSTRYCTRQYEVATDDQSEHDTCPKRVIRGCQACVSP
ncbi:hypothetical protein Tco_1462531, partial [Tanacetum coccineum]